MNALCYRWYQLKVPEPKQRLIKCRTFSPDGILQKEIDVHSFPENHLLHGWVSGGLGGSKPLIQLTLL